MNRVIQINVFVLYVQTVIFKIEIQIHYQKLILIFLVNVLEIELINLFVF